MPDQELIDVDRGFRPFVNHYLRAPGFAGGDDGDCFWMAAQIAFPAYSGVFECAFNPANADHRIDEMVAKLSDRPFPWCWFVSPMSRPTDLASRLEKRGLEKLVSLTGMAASFEEIGPGPGVGSGIEIREVQTEQDVRDYASLYPKLFHAEDESFIEQVIDAELAIFRRGPTATTQYLATKDGRPICAGSTSIQGDLATLDTLCTLPEERNQGVGGALAVLALRKEQAKGANRATIWAGPGAEKLYGRLGFREICPIDIYMPTAQ